MKFRLIDKLTLGYILFNIILIIFGWNWVHEPQKNIIVFSTFGISLYLFVKFEEKYKFVKFLKDWSPFIFFGYFFEATTSMNLIFIHHYIDPFFQKIDLAIFGYQPAIEWGRSLDNFFWQEWFHFAYFSYYLMIFGIAVWLYLKRRKNFYQYTFLVFFLFYVCYITYIFLPVIGGRFWQENMDIATKYRYGIFTRLMAFIYTNSPHKGAAFPSSHVAVALVVSLYAYKVKKMLGYILLFVTFSLAIATVYCHYHYFIDTIFGILYAIIFYIVGLKFYNNYERIIDV